MFRVFAFCLAAFLSAIGGALFTLQVGFMSPSLVGIVPSIEMVIFAAVGGRMSLVGAVYGTLLVNFGKTYFSESFPDLWLFLMAAMFLGVVLAFPQGLAGLYVEKVKPWVLKRLLRKPAVAAEPPPPAPTKRSDPPSPSLPSSLPPGVSGQQV
jgi:urea transport system permease protein